MDEIKTRKKKKEIWKWWHAEEIARTQEQQKIRSRELSETEASSRRAWNEQQNGGKRGRGVVFEGGAERYRKENRAMSQPPNQAADC